MLHQDLNHVVKHILFFNIFHVDCVDGIFKTMYEALKQHTKGCNHRAKTTNTSTYAHYACEAITGGSNPKENNAR